MGLHILFIEPFYGGSHKDFADGLITSSRHTYDLYTLPARFWKWRMRGAALYFADIIKDPSVYDLVVTSDMLSVSDLKSLWGAASPPIVLYFHENQLTYPVPKGEERDNHFGFTDITSCLSASAVLFNSRFHYRIFFSELPRFLSKMPEYKPMWVCEEIEEKSTIMYPGLSLPGKQPLEHRWKTDDTLVLWNHRWEFDKGPEFFFEVLYELDARAVPFSIALAGENFQTVPRPFIEGKAHFGDRIMQYGYIESKEEYYSLLSASNIVISTAIQENFGISIVEAVSAGCYPLLPHRLSYPEIIPEQYHSACLYTDEEDLINKLVDIVKNKSPQPSGLAEAVSTYAWKKNIDQYDTFFETVASNRD